jgi:hypothetical protein
LKDKCHQGEVRQKILSFDITLFYQCRQCASVVGFVLCKALLQSLPSVTSHAAERSSPEPEATFVNGAGIGWFGAVVNSSSVAASISANGKKTVQQVPWCSWSARLRTRSLP